VAPAVWHRSGYLLSPRRSSERHGTADCDPKWPETARRSLHHSCSWCTNQIKLGP